MDHDVRLQIVIEPLHIFILKNLVGLAFEKDLPLVHDRCAIDDLERLAHIVICNQDADAAPLQEQDEVADVANGQGIDAGERLVQQHVRRMRR